MEMKYLIPLLCLFLLIAPLLWSATGPKQTEKNLKTSTGSGSTASYSTSDAHGIQTIAGHYSTLHSKDEASAGRLAGLDCREILRARMTLSLCGAPALNAEARLNLILVPEVDAPNAEICMLLPEGLSLSSGSLQWSGSFSKDLAVQMGVSVTAEIVGDWLVEAVATGKPPNDCPKMCSARCSVRIAETESQILDVAPEDSAEKEAIRLKAGGSLDHASSASSGAITVCGNWSYESQYGTVKPARYARVELWKSGVPSDVFLASSSVQSDGYYEFSLISSGDSSDGYGLYVKLLCRGQQYKTVAVEDPSYNVYWSQTNIHYNVSDGRLDMGSWVVPREQCWAVYDSIVDGYLWLLNKVGWSRSEVYARLAEDPGGTYSTGNGMVVWPGPGWESWVRWAVLHEYGHCINYAARGQSWPPSERQDPEHYPDTETDEGWAFREGWAEFFSCAVDNDPEASYGGRFGSLETTVCGDGPYGHGDYGDWDGDIVEGAVAQIFWDILDGVDHNDYPAWDDAYGDYISDFGRLWGIFLHYYPSSIQDIWLHWNPKDANIWALFHHARIIEPRNIAITDLLSSPVIVAQGDIAQINITVKNQGDTIENFDLKAFAGNLTVGSFVNITLESGTFRTYTTALNTTGMMLGDYIISTQITIFPRDLNATDDVKVSRVRLVTLPGDINDDFKVNIVDLVILAKAYGSEAGESRWNLDADLDGDGIIGLKDLIILSQIWIHGRRR